MITADVNVNEFSRGINRLVTRVGLDSKRVVKKEVGELVKTLVKISPPSNLASSKKKPEKSVRLVFRAPPNDAFRGKKLGRKNYRWLYASPDALVGVDAKDYRLDLDSNTAKRQLYNPPRGKAGIDLGRRGKQKVIQINRKIVRRQTFNQVIRKVQNNFGRLKAGWMVGVFNGQLQLTGGNRPPAWVTKHRSGVRGATINGLETPGNPSFTIINNAKGVGSERVREITASALKIRAKAMAANLKRILSGQKEYAY